MTTELLASLSHIDMEFDNIDKSNYLLQQKYVDCISTASIWAALSIK